MFAASYYVERSEWKAFIDEIRADKIVPGYQGVGFAQVVRREDLATHEAKIRSEGFPDYSVRPAGDRPLYTSIVYLEPFEGRNLRAFGYDMYSEPVRRESMEQARDTGNAALSGKVRLVQETDKDVQAGTLMYVPVYRNGLPTQTLEQRRAAIVGWSYSPFRINDLMSGILGGWDEAEGRYVDLHIYSEEGTTPNQQLYDASFPENAAQNSAFYQAREVNFHGHKWKLTFDRIPSAPALNYIQAWVTLMVGLGLTGLLSAFVWTLQRARGAAIQAADDLRKSEAALLEAQRIAKSGSWRLSLATREASVTSEISTLLGLPADITHMVPEQLKNYFAADGYSRFEEALEAASRSGQTFDLELQFSRADGCEGWLQVRGEPICDPSGRIIEVQGTATDVTERVRARQEIETLSRQYAERNHLLETVLGNVDSHIYIKDPDGRYLYVNPLVAEHFKTQSDDVIGKTAYDFMSKEAADGFRRLDDEVFKSGVQQSGEERYVDADGRLRFYWSQKIPLKSPGKPNMLIGFSSEITESKELRGLLERQMTTDGLTGLPNRLSFQQGCNRVLSKGLAKGIRVGVLMIGLDRFKIINETLGHGAGDLILIEVARRLKSVAGSNVTVARLAGDEFALLLNNLPAPMAAATVAGDVLRELDKPHALADKQTYVTASIGIAIAPADGSAAETLIKNAETAMFHAKAHGRNSYHYFSASMEQAVFERMELERDLRNAVVNNEFELHYQPILKSGTGEVARLEALIRWNRAGVGEVSPAAFIPLAEEIGLIEPIGNWVMEESCRQLSAWHQAGLSAMQVAINLSAKQLYSPVLITRIVALLEQYQFAPEALEFEVTESMVMTDQDLQIGQLHALHALGFKIAIDDFGTGYSSLAYIQKLPIDVIKIDRAFVISVETDQASASLCRGIIALANSMNLETVAEGMETEQQRQLLATWGCTYMQGYLFSKPLPSGKMTEYLLARQSNRDTEARMTVEA